MRVRVLTDTLSYTVRARVMIIFQIPRIQPSFNVTCMSHTHLFDGYLKDIELCNHSIEGWASLYEDPPRFVQCQVTNNFLGRLNIRETPTTQVGR